MAITSAITRLLSKSARKALSSKAKPKAKPKAEEAPKDPTLASLVRRGLISKGDAKMIRNLKKVKKTEVPSLLEDGLINKHEAAIILQGKTKRPSSPDVPLTLKERAKTAVGRPTLKPEQKGTEKLSQTQKSVKAFGRRKVIKGAAIGTAATGAVVAGKEFLDSLSSEDHTSFKEAFAKARTKAKKKGDADEGVFTWKGKKFTTEVKKKGGGKVLYKRHGGMSRVGLSPAEEARAGTMSEAKRARYMQAGGPIRTTFPRRADPRTEGRAPAVDLFPKVGRKNSGTVVPKPKRKPRAKARVESYKRKKAAGKFGLSPSGKRTLKATGNVIKDVATDPMSLIPGGSTISLAKSLMNSRKKSPPAPKRKPAQEKKDMVWTQTGGQVGSKKQGKGKRISSKQTDGNKLVASIYD